MLRCAALAHDRSGGPLRRPLLAALLLTLACDRAPRTVVAPGEPLVLPEHYARSIAALGMPGAHRAFQVGHDSVIGGGDAAIAWRLIDDAGAARVSPVWFERDGVPVAHWSMATARESVAFEAAAVPCAALGDTSLLVSIEAIVTWRDAVPGASTLEARLATRADPPAVIPWDAEDTDRHEERWNGRFAYRNGLLVAGVDPTLTLTPAGGAATLTRGAGPGALAAIGRATLARGETRRWHYWMPVYPTRVAGVGIERLAGHARVAHDARAAWRDWLAHAAPLATPDSLVNAAWRAALVTLIVSHEKDAGDWVPLGNPFQYRDVWLRDAARSVRALAVAGLTDLARGDAWTLRRFQLPNGALLSQKSQLDGTGEALWAFAQAAMLPPSREWAIRTLPTVRRALDWLEVQRELTARIDMRFPGVLPYADPHDNELVRAELVGDDAWAIGGAAAAARLARLAGDDALASRALDAVVAHRRAFAAALDHCGSPDVPPSWQGVGRDWGNLTVGYPTRVLAPDDPRLERLARRVRARTPRGAATGTGAGLVSYGPADTLHSYLGTDLAQWSLFAGRPAEARAYLADLIAHGSSTLGQAELFAWRDGAFGANLPPHATAAAGLVDLVRNMVVADDRDTLELALGADRAWWRGTRLERAPTRFGTIDVTLEAPASDMRRARWTPVEAPVRVRVADGERAIQTPTPGARIVDGRWIECPPRVGAVEFRVAADPPGARGAGS
ncbi:MAG: hypothetical protein HY076_07290 [Candidatus Eisenbacteria bacterium]|uniref:Alpha-L-rhamnosidase six-hairpin glycosidase domain-containing protein n=1 Tax=Eiseniibacteriota bacterium TaxID=2212470 RepID=A0A9D6L7I7_UNCEI|nr:hypothetical protein [Candidatus Eisenbacteria bacterium]